MAETEEKQGRFTLAEAVGNGEDEYGAYQIIPLSMVAGGKLHEVKVHTKPMRHVINDSAPNPRGWYKDKEVEDRVRPRPCYTEALLTTPYGGFCPVGCRFCYVDHGTRGYRATGIPTVNPHYPEAYAKYLSKMYIAPAAYISSFTEPNQPIEDVYHVVQRLSEVLTAVGLPLFYLSRKLVPDWAFDFLQANPYSYMQWSINSSKTSVYKKLSPGSFTIEEVMGDMLRLSNAGIYVSVQCNPVLPGIVDLEDLKQLVRMVADNGGRHIIFKFAEQVYSNRKLLLGRLSGIPGSAEFEKMFTQSIGGVYTIAQDIRVAWLTELLAETRANGITMSTCYEYYANGAGGANLAPWFTTSDQCHGRGVPMFYRETLQEQFKPLPGCYRKGCLYCKDFGTHACQNSKLLEADALKYKDYKDIKLSGDDSLWDLPDSCARPTSIEKSRAANPNMVTDAELWGLKDLEDVL